MFQVSIVYFNIPDFIVYLSVLYRYTVCLLHSVKKYFVIAQTEMHLGSQNMSQNFIDARTNYVKIEIC